MREQRREKRMIWLETTPCWHERESADSGCGNVGGAWGKSFNKHTPQNNPFNGSVVAAFAEHGFAGGVTQFAGRGAPFSGSGRGERPKAGERRMPLKAPLNQARRLGEGRRGGRRRRKGRDGRERVASLSHTHKTVRSALAVFKSVARRARASSTAAPAPRRSSLGRTCRAPREAS
ncbi:hypothetical protein M885DRAFT_80920 [Pelagophyceae sp. CCMP2097]|nr:hypothetical protein M885DRAFT_80920 [Pelagophyceae sp. CCMP2097]